MHCHSVTVLMLMSASTALAISRRAVLAGSAMVPAAAMADASNPFAPPPPPRVGLQTKWLEQLRIVLQDEADNVQYGGELAPGGPPPAVPALQLIPIVQMQAKLRKSSPMVDDQAQWPALYQIMTTGSFADKEFKRIFNLYADNIYYSASTAEANGYLLGGATPSTSQTTQYLLRNEMLKYVSELADEIKYQQGLPTEKRETEAAREYMDKLLKYFDEYLGLSPPPELKLAREAVYGEGKQM